MAPLSDAGRLAEFGRRLGEIEGKLAKCVTSETWCEFQEEWEAMKTLLYGDPAAANPGGIRSMLTEAIGKMTKTEETRAQDRQREKEDSAATKSQLDRQDVQLDKISKKMGLTRGRLALVKEVAGTIAFLVILLDGIAHIHELLGWLGNGH